MRYRKDWHDMSPWLVHFTSGKTGASPYDQMMGILSEGKIEAREFGEFRNLAPNGLQKVACFSEIPPEYWMRLADHRKSSHGIGFTKEYIIRKGGNPILYVWPGAFIHSSLSELANEKSRDASSPFWDIAAFIQIQNPRNSWDWEREWRVPKDLQFTPSDVSFLILPEELHLLAKVFFENALEDNSGPSYDCPFVDASWDMARIQRVLDR